MRNLILAAGMAAAIVPMAAAPAQSWNRGYNDNYRSGGSVRQEQRECQRELRHADSRREYNRELAECRREIAQAERRQYGNRYGYGYGNGDNSGYYRDDGRYWDGYRWRSRY